MSTLLSPEGLQAPTFLNIGEGIQLVHMLRPQPDVGTVVQLLAARDNEGTSSLARDLCLTAVRELGLRTILLDMDGSGRKQIDWVRRSHNVPFALAGSISVRPTALTVLRVGASQFHVGEPSGGQPVPVASWPGILKLLRPRFDLVVIDSPAFARSFDGVIIAPHVDGTLLVIEAEATKATHVQNLRDRVIEAGGKVVGTILNKRKFHIPEAIYERV
jgi:Mrp family chromosome partitioning ATPase